jgi:hypothetical protein
MLALLLACGVVQAARETPVTKVVGLINEMKAKIEADGKAEQKVYDKFACWCEKTTARKAGAIEEAKTSIEELSQRVLMLKGKTATLKAEIAQLEKDVAGNIDGTKEATSIRERETADYSTQRTDLEAAIGALERAVGILTGAGEFAQKSASALQQAELLSVAGGLQGALRIVKVGDDYGAISQSDKAAVESFVHDPSPFVHPKFSGIQQKNPHGDYAPASGAIQGILKGMYDSFTADLESKNADQALRQKNYEELTATKDSELNTLKSTLAKKKETLGEDTKTMTDSSIERDETQAQLKADEKFFEDTKLSCKNQADAWAERSRLRTEELAGINKAVEILTSDEAGATFGRATSMLLQSTQGTAAAAKKHAAFKAVKAVARKHHSLRLAALAALIQTSTEGHFNVVVDTVDKQLAELRQEEQDDIDMRAYCAAEEDKTANEIEDLQHKMTNLQGAIDRLNSKKKEIQADIVSTEGDITDTENAMAEALSTRNSEHEDFKAALKDDMDAVALLAAAIDALTAFSKNNKLPLGLMQKKHKKHHSHHSHAAKHLKKQPEYSVDEDKAPETFSDGGYKGQSSEGGGIVSIIGYIKEDLENEIATTKKAEATAQKDYENQRKAALEALAALKTKKNNLETQEADTDEKITDATEEKELKNTRKGQKEQYADSLKPKCEWIKGAFDTRKTKREDEIQGLLDAKGSLSGDSAGFLQKA